MGVDTDGQNLYLPISLIREQSFQLSELPYAEGSPVSPVKNQHHLPSPVKIGEGDFVPIHVLKGKIRGPIADLDPFQVGGIQGGRVGGLRLRIGFAEKEKDSQNR